MNVQSMAFQEAKPSMWTKGSIDNLGERIASQLEFQPGDDIVELVKRLGGDIRYQDPSDWLSTESGSIEVRGPREFVIYVSNFTSRERDRFTIAHELGHFVLHSNCGKVPIRVPRSGTNRLEWEANWFAAGFLMPASIFRSAWAESPSVIAMAAKFDVSIQAARVRKETLGLNEENSA